jgi:hypothetical protein
MKDRVVTGFKQSHEEAQARKSFKAISVAKPDLNLLLDGGAE